MSEDWKLTGDTNCSLAIRKTSSSAPRGCGCGPDLGATTTPPREMHPREAGWIPELGRSISINSKCGMVDRQCGLGGGGGLTYCERCCKLCSED